DVEPPDRIGEEARDHHGPGFAKAEQSAPARTPLERSAVRAAAVGRDVLALLVGDPRVPLGDGVDQQPQPEPDESEHARDDERRSPAVGDREPGDDRRRQRTANRRAGIQDAHAERAFAHRKPFTDNLGGARPVAGLAETEHGAADPKAGGAPGGGMEQRGGGPDHNRTHEAAPRADRVEQAARHHLADRVKHEKGVLHGGVVAVRQTQVRRDRALEHGHRLTVDVVDDRGEEDERDDDPAEARNLHAHLMNRPPLISIVSPVRYDASLLARNATTEATSSGVPARERGTVFSAAANASPGVKRAWKSVPPMRPGDTQFTRTPEGASSFASALVIAMTAALAAAYANAPGPPPLCAASDDIMTMAPRPRGAIRFATACVQRNALITFTSRI